MVVGPEKKLVLFRLSIVAGPEKKLVLFRLVMVDPKTKLQLGSGPLRL